MSADLTVARKLSGATHIVNVHRLGLSSFCTGRWMSEAFTTDEPVSCKPCIKKAGSLGMDPNALSTEGA